MPTSRDRKDKPKDDEDLEGEPTVIFCSECNSTRVTITVKGWRCLACGHEW